MPDSREAAIAAALAADAVIGERYVTRVLDTAYAAGHIHYTDACDSETAEWEKRWTDAEYAWRERIGVLEAIVRDLAAQHPEPPTTGHDDSDCALCGDYLPNGHDDPECCWLRAREWLDQQEATG